MNNTLLEMLPRTIAIDLDGVLAQYSGWHYNIQDPYPGAKEFVEQLKEMGWLVILHSTRGREHMRTWADSHKIPYDAINESIGLETDGEKPVAHVYLDDRGMRFNGDYSKTIQMLKERVVKPWWEKAVLTKS